MENVPLKTIASARLSEPLHERIREVASERSHMSWRVWHHAAGLLALDVLGQIKDFEHALSLCPLASADLAIAHGAWHYLEALKVGRIKHREGERALVPLGTRGITQTTISAHLHQAITSAKREHGLSWLGWHHYAALAGLDAMGWIVDGEDPYRFCPAEHLLPAIDLYVETSRELEPRHAKRPDPPPWSGRKLTL